MAGKFFSSFIHSILKEDHQRRSRTLCEVLVSGVACIGFEENADIPISTSPTSENTAQEQLFPE